MKIKLSKSQWEKIGQKTGWGIYKLTWAQIKKMEEKIKEGFEIYTTTNEGLPLMIKKGGDSGSGYEEITIAQDGSIQPFEEKYTTR